MGTVIKSPIGGLGQEPSLLAEFSSQSSGRVGSEDAEYRNLDARCLDKIHCPPEDIFSVVFMAEDKCAFNNDAVVVEDLDILLHPIRPDPRFVRGVQIFLEDRFKADEELDAARFCGEVEQFTVPCERNRSKTSPFYLERGEGSKNFLRITGIASDIVVNEEDRSR